MDLVIYINKSRNLLTYGKTYKILKAIEVGDKLFYRIINNLGEEESYSEKSFKRLDEIREEKLNRLGI